ncbi:MAG: DUF2064 domain-containing protein [Candidatus Sericytochromatia bacterium]|nr:DUF2064 domain-containing protein [Candidatus Sericytochromatia bacterium]
MRQGIIIFAEAHPPGSPGERSLKAAVEAAVGAPEATPFVAYGDAAASQRLRTLVGGPPPRFFPQATRTRLGERLQQAYAFLFVQDYERVAIVVGDYPVTPEAFTGAFAALQEAPLHIEEAGGAAYLIALRRADFPVVAPVFEDVPWERTGAREAALARLAEAEQAPEGPPRRRRPPDS